MGWRDLYNMQDVNKVQGQDILDDIFADKAANISSRPGQGDNIQGQGQVQSSQSQCMVNCLLLKAVFTMFSATGVTEVLLSILDIHPLRSVLRSHPF
jgi:hypothetical protein